MMSLSNKAFANISLLKLMQFLWTVVEFLYFNSFCRKPFLTRGQKKLKEVLGGNQFENLHLNFKLIIINHPQATGVQHT